jgi:hypothetical protein
MGKSGLEPTTSRFSRNGNEARFPQTGPRVPCFSVVMILKVVKVLCFPELYKY